MADLATLQARRAALEESITSGVMSASVDGQAVSFASLSDRQKLLNDIIQQIADCTGQNSKRPKSASIYLGGF